MKNVRAIILAAGQGKRMKSDLPKVLHPVCGQPIIQYVLKVAKAAGSLKTYVVLGHKSELVKKGLSRNAVIVLQRSLLGTADAIRSTWDHFRKFNGDVLVLCGDTPLLNKKTILRLVARHKNSKSSCTFLTAEVADPTGYGRIIRNERRLPVAIVEEKDTTLRQRAIHEINVGAYCFRSRDLFDTIKAIRLNRKKGEFYLTDIVDLLVKRGRKLGAVTTEDETEALGINGREDLALAESVLRHRILRGHMERGVTIVDPTTTYIAADVTIGRDTTIYPFTVIEEDVHIGRRCLIGPFARLRPGSRLGHEVEVGNFTEVSRSTVGDRTLMKHFSFLGDAKVGAEVNIGAGVVTANFDGKSKNKTWIADQAFIGSDSILVAPVKVGKKAITGAGSVVTKGKIVPAGRVAFGVPAKIMARSKLR